MQNPIDGSGSFSLDRAAEYLNRITAENDIDALLLRAQKNTEQTAQNAAVEAAQRAADEVIAKNTAAMAQGAIGETVQNVAEVPVAAQTSEKTPAAAHVSKEEYEASLRSAPEMREIMTSEQAALYLFTIGQRVGRSREGNTLTQKDFEQAA
jgi:cell pole-organizing protein PopZ